MVLVHLAVAFVGSFVYCSFLEWVLHKHFMHSSRFMREPFERHAVQRDAVHQPPLAVVVVDREMPGGPVVPERDRAFAPDKPGLEFGP